MEIIFAVFLTTVVVVGAFCIAIENGAFSKGWRHQHAYKFVSCENIGSAKTRIIRVCNCSKIASKVHDGFINLDDLRNAK